MRSLSAGNIGERQVRYHGFRLGTSRIFCHSYGVVQKIAFTFYPRTVPDLDRYVGDGRFPNRSRAPQSAVESILLTEREKRSQIGRYRLRRMIRGRFA